MAPKPRIAIIGPGNLGATLAVALHRAGYRISEIVFRQDGRSKLRAGKVANEVGARPVEITKAKFGADVIWFSVLDSAIRDCARALAERGQWKGRMGFHSSGALAATELLPLQRRGAAVASVHPLMTFVQSAKPNLRGVPFAIEGDNRAVGIARRIVRDLEGKAFLIKAKDKSLYHAWGAFASSLLVALLAEAEEVALAAGVSRASARKKMLPILRQTLQNYADHGAAAAFSGPLVRGDVATVQRHLKVLSRLPRAREIYLALADSALNASTL